VAHFYGDNMTAPSLSALGAVLAEVSHPVLPAPAVWAGAVVIVILFLFLAATVIGPIVRALMRE